MSRNYKFHNKGGLYFVSFATVCWLDVFVREEYFECMKNSLSWCQREQCMELFGWCIMPSHVHLVFRAGNNNPGDLLRKIKTYTSKKLQGEIAVNPQESKRDWMLWMMEKVGEHNSNVKYRQFWQQHNKPTELWSPDVIFQKLACPPKFNS